MAPRKMPSILKRQKEAQRAAKASRKREAKQMRSQAKAAGLVDEFGQMIESPETTSETEGENTGA